jgi:hypothetical protein
LPAHTNPPSTIKPSKKMTKTGKPDHTPGSLSANKTRI